MSEQPSTGAKQETPKPGLAECSRCGLRSTTLLIGPKGWCRNIAACARRQAHAERRRKKDA